MLDQGGFDQWAGEYDEGISKHSKGYPFEGYYDVLSYVQSLVNASIHTHVLDIGVGTGLLTYELYKKGYMVYGIDFSTKMLALAKQKMPEGFFYQYDFSMGLPAELETHRFDYILSSYAIHHIDDPAKVKLINHLYHHHLHQDGKIILADISFRTDEELEKCKREAGQSWDDDEYYFVAERFRQELQRIGLETKYRQISSCAGVFVIK